MQKNKIYSSRGKAVFLIPFGGVMLFLAGALPFVMESPLLCFILMSVPMAFGGFVSVVQGLASAYARIEITVDELKMVLPGWRGFPAPPMRRISLRWHEVLAVRRRVEVYTAIIPPAAVIPFAVNVYAIDTDHGRFILGGQVVRGLPEAIEEISDRSEHPVQFEGEVSVKLLRCLLRGTPAWQSPVPGR